MSKRGSSNAIRFAGKKWSVGSNFKVKVKVKKASKKTNNQSARDVRRTDKFNKICRKFNFDKSIPENKQLYEKLLKDFIKLRAMKGSRIAAKSVKNVEYFQSYCVEHNIDFNIKIYFQKNFNIIDFSKR